MEDILEKVRDFADTAHGEQTRKYTRERYIVHPIRVMETCRLYNPTLPALSAALLHDVLEDTPVNETELLDFLNSIMSNADAKETLSLVKDLTDVYIKSDYPQWNRKIRKAKELERIGHTSPDAQTIKYADIIDNCNEIVMYDPGFAPRLLSECLNVLQLADKGDNDLRNKALKTVEHELMLLKRKHL